MKKEEVANKMKGETLSKAAKRTSRILKKPFVPSFDVKGTHKSMRRHREKEGMPF